MKPGFTLIFTLVIVALFALPAAARFMPIKAENRQAMGKSGGQFMPLHGGAKKPASLQLASLSTNQFKPLPQNRIISHAIKSPSEEMPEEGMEEVAAITEPSPLPAVLPASESQHIWPIAEAEPSPISSPFGYRTHPITGKYAMHEGVDIAAPQGSSVIASADGVVAAIGRHPRLGNYVKLTHDDGTYSLYGHLQDVLVQQGAKLRQGNTLGTVGSTGRSTGAHLDYSLREADGTAMDPLPYISTATIMAQLAAN